MRVLFIVLPFKHHIHPFSASFGGSLSPDEPSIWIWKPYHLDWSVCSKASPQTRLKYNDLDEHSLRQRPPSPGFVCICSTPYERSVSLCLRFSIFLYASVCLCLAPTVSVFLICLRLFRFVCVSLCLRLCQFVFTSLRSSRLSVSSVRPLYRLSQFVSMRGCSVIVCLRLSRWSRFLRVRVLCPGLAPCGAGPAQLVYGLVSVSRQ